MIMLWVRSLAFRASLRVWGTAASVAIAVALLVSLSTFLAQSSASMTARAVSAVPIDWQVELVPSADAGKTAEAIRKAARVTALHDVNYADTAGFKARTGGTVQTTGPGKVVAFDKGYSADFPKEFRLLSGSLNGPLLAQQTAANLHAGPNDTITIERVGLAPVDVKIAGVVELPDADALFQGVGLPPSASPQAPPDNVVIFPASDWHRIFDPQQAARPDSTRLQMHVRIDHATLPADPGKAYAFVEGASRNLESRVAGKALVANNLGARLDAVRSDALYAKVLFLFLGLPGILLAATLTMATTRTHASQRRIEQALLRTRGASTAQILGLAGGEALVIAGIGIVFGFAMAAVFNAVWMRGAGISVPGIGSVFTAGCLGLALSLICVLLPAWIGVRNATVAASRTSVVRGSSPTWGRYYPDLLLLAAGGLVFWQSASSGYQIVLAPEGVAATSVDYKAFIAPAFFWAGAVLLALRLSYLALNHDSAFLSHLVKPIAGTLTPAVTATLKRQAPRVAAGVAMLTLAVSFAVSTAVFNRTYEAQSRVDAELTNGSDVTVFGTTANPAGANLRRLSSLPAAQAAEPMQHRFAYVGSDLQDMYGIDPNTIGRATSLSNAYFSGGDASATLAKLAATPDGVLVSEETVRDFQLKLGDAINLRLMDSKDDQYHAVPFTFIGVAREFPTAPKDSFLVANAAYIAKSTHTNAAEYVLMKASGDATLLARQASNVLSGDPVLKVKDIGTVSHIIGSNLTAVDLKGLTRIELAFAVIMATAASGLLLLLGFFERRRVFALLNALGAKPWQMAAFIWSEGILVLTGGLIFGSVAGLSIAWLLVKLLKGAFDPPPEALTYPVAYLGLLFVLVVAATVAALWLTVHKTAAPSQDLLRDTVRA